MTKEKIKVKMKPAKWIRPVKYHRCMLCQRKILLGKDIEGCCSKKHMEEYNKLIKAHILRTGRFR